MTRRYEIILLCSIAALIVAMIIGYLIGPPLGYAAIPYAAGLLGVLSAHYVFSLGGFETKIVTIIGIPLVLIAVFLFV